MPSVCRRRGNTSIDAVWNSKVLTKEIHAEIVPLFKAVKKADKKYKSFGGIKKNAEGSVKFVIETDPIETEEN